MNSREAFEAWYQNEYVQFGRANFHFNSYGEYFDDDIEASWCAWQAALASQAAELSSNPLQLPSQAQQPTAYRVIASANGEVVRDSLEFTRMSEIDEKVVRKSYDLEIIPLYAPEIYSRSSLEQFDLDQSKEYNAGRKDGRVIGYEVGYRHATEKSQAQQEPSKDIHEAITLLSAVFDAWENGTDCYDDFDGVSGSFIGKAFNLDDEIFKRCCDLLNRVNPPRNVSQAQQSQWISVEDQFPDHRNDVLCFVVSNHGDTAIKSSHLNPAMTGFYVDYEFDEPIETVTHWMPLPPAPEGGKP